MGVFAFSATALLMALLPHRRRFSVLAAVLLLWRPFCFGGSYQGGDQETASPDFDFEREPFVAHTLKIDVKATTEECVYQKGYPILLYLILSSLQMSLRSTELSPEHSFDAHSALSNSESLRPSQLPLWRSQLSLRPSRLSAPLKALAALAKALPALLEALEHPLRPYQLPLRPPLQRSFPSPQRSSFPTELLPIRL